MILVRCCRVLKHKLRRERLTWFVYARNSRLFFNLNLVEIRIDTLTEDGEVIGRAALNLFVAETKVIN